ELLAPHPTPKLEGHPLPAVRDCLFNIFAASLERMRWAGHIARMVETRNAYRILVGKPEGKRPLERPRHMWVDNIKMALREIGWYGMDWIDMAQDRDQWRALVNTVMNFRVS
ncbi:hypothetical protein B7P43_G14398, partial [Cryptotermes secundus]